MHTVFSQRYAHLQFVAHPPVWALSQFQILCNSMGNHIQSVAHPLFFSNLTLFSTERISERIQYIQNHSVAVHHSKHHLPETQLRNEAEIVQKFLQKCVLTSANLLQALVDEISCNMLDNKTYMQLKTNTSASLVRNGIIN